MKKIFAAATVLCTSFGASAQDNFEPLKDRQLFFDVLNICAILAVIYLITGFILRLVKQYLDHRLKSRIIDRQTPEGIVQQLITTEKKDKGQVFMQWFFVLAGIALGFVIIRLTMPFGPHSLAILAGCLAAGCAGAYYFTRRTSKA